MKVIVEKKQVVGTITTLLGRYSLLSLEPWKTDMPHYYRQVNALSFHVVDDEGFSNRVYVHGDFMIIPTQVPSMVNVKRIVTESEVQEVEILTAATID